MPLNKRLEFTPEPTISLNEKQQRIRDIISAKYQRGAYETESVPCYCGETDGHEVAQRDRYGFPVRTVLCMQCGLLRTTPRMTVAAANRFYKEDYRDLYDGAWNSLDERFAHDLRVGKNTIAKIPNIMSAVHTVFDVGCASGGKLKAFDLAGKQTAGCDMNRKYLDYGRSQGLCLIEGDASTLRREFGGPADLVLLSHVLEHFFDLKAELDMVVDAVRPGGLVLIIVPGLSTVPGEYHGDLLLYFQNVHNYHFTASTLRYVLASIGVDVLAVDNEGTALVRRPEQWVPGGEYPLAIPKTAGFENLALLSRVEEALSRQ